MASTDKSLPAWKCHCSIDTVLYADSVEFCQLPGHKNLLACCLYQLKEATDTEKATRLGSILLYDVRSSEQGVSCQEIHRIEGIAGVLDLKWFPHPVQGCPAVVMARADGTCCIQRIAIEKDGSVSSSVVACAVAQEDGLCLGVDVRKDSSEDRLCVLTSTSDGSVVCYVGEKKEGFPSRDVFCLEETARWQAHGFEAWYAVFDVQQMTKVYSGGDDCVLKVVQLAEGTAYPLSSKRYEAGLCAMQFRPGHPEQLAIGGYEQVVYLYNTSGFKKPLCQIDVGGGVWRIKWNSANSHYLATASMYNGFHILHLSEEYEFSIVLHYDNHTANSLGYGISWQCREESCAGDGVCEPDTGASSSCAEKNATAASTSVGAVTGQVVASCSFYDHCLQIWTITSAAPSCDGATA